MPAHGQGNNRRAMMVAKAGRRGEEDCAICLSPMDDPAGTHALECGHQFHTGCIVESLRRSGPACPMCRAQPPSATTAAEAATTAAEAATTGPSDPLVDLVLRLLSCGGHTGDPALRTMVATVVRMVTAGSDDGLFRLTSGGFGGDSSRTWSFHVQF